MKLSHHLVVILVDMEANPLLSSRKNRVSDNPTAKNADLTPVDSKWPKAGDDPNLDNPFILFRSKK
jgi:hypothetical protein